MKLSNGLRREVREKQELAAEQSFLKKKHGIAQDQEVVVVEKSNMVKFLLRYLGFGIRLAATILLLFLAFIGLVAIVYPEPRMDLLTIFQNVQKDLFSFF